MWKFCFFRTFYPEVWIHYSCNEVQNSKAKFSKLNASWERRVKGGAFRGLYINNSRTGSLKVMCVLRETFKIFRNGYKSVLVLRTRNWSFTGTCVQSHKTKSDLYKIMYVHELKQPDYAARIDFCIWFCKVNEMELWMHSCHSHW